MVLESMVVYLRGKDNRKDYYGFTHQNFDMNVFLSLAFEIDKSISHELLVPEVV